MATTLRYNSLIRARDVRSEEDPDKHNQGGHDSRRNPEEDPGGRVASQESRYGYQPRTYRSGSRRDADFKLLEGYTDATTSCMGHTTMRPPNSQVPAYQAPSPDQSVRPKGRGGQEDSPSHSYERRQPNAEKSKNGPPVSMHEQVSRREALPLSGPRHSRTESTTKKTPRSSRQTEQEEDEEIDDKRVLSFISSSGIDIEVLVFYLQRYLGHDTDAQPGKHPGVSILATKSDSY